MWTDDAIREAFTEGVQRGANDLVRPGECIGPHAEKYLTDLKQKARQQTTPPSVITMSARLSGQQQCALGNHVWTPWLALPNGAHVIKCSRAGCQHEVRYDV